MDIAKAVANYTAERERLKGIPYLKADEVKLFVDGVLEGNIYAEQPILPNAAVLHPYQQPITVLDAAVGVTIKGYVDPEGAICQEAAAHGEYAPDDAKALCAVNGFGPPTVSGRQRFQAGAMRGQFRGAGTRS